MFLHCAYIYAKILGSYLEWNMSIVFVPLKEHCDNKMAYCSHKNLQ